MPLAVQARVLATDSHLQIAHPALGVITLAADDARWYAEYIAGSDMAEMAGTRLRKYEDRVAVYSSMVCAGLHLDDEAVVELVQSIEAEESGGPGLFGAIGRRKNSVGSKGPFAPSDALILKLDAGLAPVGSGHERSSTTNVLVLLL